MHIFENCFFSLKILKSHNYAIFFVNELCDFLGEIYKLLAVLCIFLPRSHKVHLQRKWRNYNFFKFSNKYT